MKRFSTALVGFTLFCAAAGLGFFSGLQFAQAVPDTNCNDCNCAPLDTYYYNGGGGTFYGFQKNNLPLASALVPTGSGVVYTRQCGTDGCRSSNTNAIVFGSYDWADATCIPDGPVTQDCVQEMMNGQNWQVLANINQYVCVPCG